MNVWIGVMCVFSVSTDRVEINPKYLSLPESRSRNVLQNYLLSVPLACDSLQTRSPFEACYSWCVPHCCYTLYLRTANLLSGKCRWDFLFFAEQNTAKEMIGPAYSNKSHSADASCGNYIAASYAIEMGKQFLSPFGLVNCTDPAYSRP